MSVQDAQDIVQMNSLSGEIPIASGGKKKSSLLWIVLGCVVVGVGLGVFVYQQSLAPAPKPSATPRASKAPTPSATTVVPSPVVPTTNEVAPVANTLTFPKKGKLRIYHDLNNIQMVIQLTINGTVKTITLPNKAASATTPMNFADSSFEVEAGSVGTITAYLNSTSGPKLRGWVTPTDTQKKVCGSNGATPLDWEPKLVFVQAKLAGESIFEYQCWEDDDTPGEFNDLYMLWTYVPNTSATSPSPAASVSPSPSASVKASSSPSPSPSVKASVSPSPSVKASTAATVASPTPTPSTRAAMPDTSEGVPVTGVFEITVGTVSVGLLLLVLGLFGLLSL